MKAVVGITGLMLIFCFTIKAQDKEKASKIEVPAWEKQWVVADTAQRIFKPIKGWLPQDDSLYTIPNAYRSNGVIYTLPIKKLNGQGLASMPGTVNLDRMKPDVLLDSISQYKGKK